MPISAAEVHFTERAQVECDVLGLSTRSVAGLVAADAFQDPGTYAQPFMSLPLVFSNVVAEVSWDGSQALVTSVLSLDRTQPVAESWLSLVSLYREATNLPYRSQFSGAPLLPEGAGRTVGHFRRLIKQLRHYLRALSENCGVREEGDAQYESVLELVEAALARGETTAGVGGLEYLLSSVHRQIYDLFLV